MFWRLRSKEAVLYCRISYVFSGNEWARNWSRVVGEEYSASEAWKQRSHRSEIAASEFYLLVCVYSVQRVGRYIKRRCRRKHARRMTKSLGSDMFHFGTSHGRRVIIISGGERTKCLHKSGPARARYCSRVCGARDQCLARGLGWRRRRRRMMLRILCDQWNTIGGKRRHTATSDRQLYFYTRSPGPQSRETRRTKGLPPRQKLSHFICHITVLYAACVCVCVGKCI